MELADYIAYLTVVIDFPTVKDFPHILCDGITI